MNTQYFVNHKTRMCQLLSGRGQDHEANVADALKSGFVEVTGEEQNAFRADTQKARDAGWIPTGRTSYAAFVEKSTAAFVVYFTPKTGSGYFLVGYAASGFGGTFRPSEAAKFKTMAAAQVVARNYGSFGTECSFLRLSSESF